MVEVMTPLPVPVMRRPIWSAVSQKVNMQENMTLSYDKLGETICRTLDDGSDSQNGGTHDNGGLPPQGLSNEHGHKGTQPAPNVINSHNKALELGIALGCSGIDSRELLGECSARQNATHNTLLISEENEGNRAGQSHQPREPFAPYGRVAGLEATHSVHRTVNNVVESRSSQLYKLSSNLEAVTCIRSPFNFKLVANTTERMRPYDHLHGKITSRPKKRAVSLKEI